MPPLQHQFEVLKLLLGPYHARGHPGTMNRAIGPRPRIVRTIDVDELILAQRNPSRPVAIYKRLRRRLLGGSVMEGDCDQEQRNSDVRKLRNFDLSCHAKALMLQNQEYAVSTTPVAML